MSRKRLFSGVQPTGELHLGNYFGAIANWVRLQETHDAIYSVVDYHAMTMDYDPAEMPGKVLDLARDLMACGLSPDKCTLMVQSDVPVHTELMWVFSTVASMGRLENMTQFKEKSLQNESGINAGLFTYPVLQAADILIYKAEAVPVGDDQLQHVELSRDLARRFNNRFGEAFPEPAPLLTDAPRIMGLDGSGKMSKSLDNYISITDPPDVVWDRLRPAFTDPARVRLKDPGDPDVCNIFTMHKQVSPQDQIDDVDRMCRSAGRGCVDCKKLLHDNLIPVLEPIRKRADELKARPDDVRDALKLGADRCRGWACTTMEEVREKAGLGGY
jgi:tryptophanyl-tRNA synthetase